MALRSSKTRKERREAGNRLPSQLIMPSHFLVGRDPKAQEIYPVCLSGPMGEAHASS